MLEESRPFSNIKEEMEEWSALEQAAQGDVWVTVPGSIQEAF